MKVTKRMPHRMDALMPRIMHSTMSMPPKMPSHCGGKTGGHVITQFIQRNNVMPQINPSFLQSSPA